MEQLLQDKLADIAELCEAYGVLRLEVFGSGATGQFDPQHSDVDFIVQFAPDDRHSLGHRFIELADRLEQLTGHKVDLLSDQPIENPYFRAAVQQTRRPLYVRAPS